MKGMSGDLAQACLIAELAADREFAVSYAKAAMAKICRSSEQGAGLLALRLVAEAYGGLGAVAEATGVSRATVYRTLSAEGNPRLDIFIALLRIIGLHLSVEENQMPIQLKPLKRGAPKKT